MTMNNSVKYTEKDELAVFGPAGGSLSEAVSPFADFWGTVNGFTMTSIERNKFDEKGVRTDEKWMIRVMRLNVLMDSGMDTHEDFDLPYDRKTGAVKIDEATGLPKRPDKNSKWGRFETLLVNSGLDFSHPTDLIGLHAHFMQRKVTTEGSRPIEINGKFIVEYDGYNNVMRKEEGLAARNTQPGVITFPVSNTTTTTPADEAATELKALGLMVGRTRVEILSALSEEKISLRYGHADYIGKLVEEGVLAQEGKTYVAGANYPLA